MSTLLITGAAGGIGRELVTRALACGDTVIAAVYDENERGRLGAQQRLHTVLMNVSSTNSVEQGFAEVDRMLNGKLLDAVVHTAAICKPNVIEVATVEEFEQTLNVNALGSLRVLKAAIPRLRGHDGRLVLMASLWGKAAGAMVGAYCASKHAVEALADTARRETAGMGLHIVVVEPGVVSTTMVTSQAAACEAAIAGMSVRESDVYGTLYRRYSNLTLSGQRTAISPAQCAAVIEKALRARRPRPRYRAGIDSKIVCTLSWLLPDRWMDALMGLSLNRKPLPDARAERVAG